MCVSYLSEERYESDLSCISLCAKKEAMHILSSGLENRKVSATDMNSESSRSQSIFRVTVQTICCQARKSVTQSMQFTLDLVDLAGYERVGKPGAAGAGREDAKSINGGLLTLGNVIQKVCRSL